MTIAALASPPGSVARAVVRLSGPGVVDALRALCVGIDDAALRTRGVHRVVLDLHASNRCPALCVRTLAGASFTGEDCCELLVAGGPHVPAMVLSRVLSLDGVRQAHAGEFAARAYLAGRLTLAQAEGIAATIAARAGAQLAAAARLREGTTGAMLVRWRDEVLHLLALVEAGIDFTDQEDVTPIAPHALRARAQEVRDAIAHELGGAGRAEPGGEPLVSLVGAPNAGKSTLFNALLGRERAVASPAPGTTRDVLRESLDLSADLAPGMGVLLHDLAGLDASALADQHSPNAAHTADAAAQHAARAAAKASDVLLWCDPTGAFDEPALHALLGFAPRAAGVLRVRTCADRVAHADLPDGGAIPVCALDGWNLAPLRRAIADRAHHAHDDSLWSLLPRHARALREAHDALDHVARAVAHAPSARAISPEILAEHLRTALTALGEVSGELSPDDVLGKVFATFCVGK